MMWLADALTAFQALIAFLFMPAALLAGLGAYFWYLGVQKNQPDKQRLGKMMLMFGIIFFAILFILQYFLATGPLTWTGLPQHFEPDAG
jgi:hypothetical protein